MCLSISPIRELFEEVFLEISKNSQVYTYGCASVPGSLF